MWIDYIYKNKYCAANCNSLLVVIIEEIMKIPIWNIKHLRPPPNLTYEVPLSHISKCNNIVILINNI
jgi:hypothetical protein